jgi:hypothetical protein
MSDDEASPKSVTSSALGTSHPARLGRMNGLVRRHANLALAAYPVPVSPSGRYAGETFRNRLKRQHDDPRSPGGVYDPSIMVTREHLVINHGKRARHCTGLAGKLYNKHDIVAPILDSMKMLYHCRGWDMDPSMVIDNAPNIPMRHATSDEQLHTLGYGPAPAEEPAPLCKGCRSTNRNDFTLTADKSHMVCKCGVVCAPVHIAQDREKNCAREDDKTTHADKPYQPRTDRFDHPAQSCDELRKQRERDAQGTRISKKAKQKLGLGWTHEHNAREAARAERQRNDMEPKDQTKGQHILIEMEKLFTPLEPIDNKIKRFCRTEADRAWREAVRHSKICKAKGRCQLRVKEKGPAVIADAVLTCSLNALLDGHDTPLDGVSRAGLLVIADKLGALQNAKGTSCALRAVRTVVGTLLSHNRAEPIEPCPLAACGASCQPSPAPSSASEAPAHAAAALPPVAGSAPFQRTDSSVSDVGDPSNELLQQRDSLHKVFKAIGTSMPNSVQRAALRAIQDTSFRAALAVAQAENSDIGRLSQNGLSLVLLSAVAQQAEQATGIAYTSKIPSRLLADFASSAAQLEAAAGAIRVLLPEGLNTLPPSEEDGLFG